MAEKKPLTALDKLPGGMQLRALRGALEHSLTIQRDKLQLTVDDMVAQGKLTREDADQLVGRLVTSSQGYTQAIVHVLDSAVAEARKGVSGTVSTVSEMAGGMVRAGKGRFRSRESS